jgi:hypothetical protein
VETSSSDPSAVLDLLLKFIERGKRILEKGDVKIGRLKMWSGAVRSHLKKIYGDGHPIIETMTPSLISASVDPSQELALRVRLLKQFVREIQRVGATCFIQRNFDSRVFIGHGQSPIWRELKDFLSDRLSLPWDNNKGQALLAITYFRVEITCGFRK